MWERLTVPVTAVTAPGTPLSLPIDALVFGNDADDVVRYDSSLEVC